jgi:NADH-quinone oxidoreductase subunit H
MATVSAVATTLFLGGWQAPWGLVHIWPGANEGYWPVLWFFAKVLLFIYVFIWLRGTLPRLRYDQFMAFGWKYLIPISLAWIVAVATVRSVLLEGGIDRQYFLIGVGVLAALFLVLMFFGSEEDGQGEADEAAADPFAGGYPVPPMPSGGAVRGNAQPLTFDSGLHRTSHERGTDG